MSAIKCYFDGSCDPNPGGEMGWGWLIRDVTHDSGCVAKCKQNSNNVAEYMAVYHLLIEIERLAAENVIPEIVVIHGDSKLVINQMSGLWKIKNGLYKPWAQKSQALLKRIENQHDIKVEFEWIRRDFNVEADELSKKYCENQINTEHLSVDWVKATAKAMVDSGEMTLEDLVDYVSGY